ncbi:hypothetical protein CC86DRAFT_181176 [Ophiobolus disseminans]|uniref:Uncharacterized protein n=1 Tax=Ophiobolus disseminans TaxID=1469910 RepID=A0A6A7ABN8_9PLEO|nr:hypothetical protein CC86DRAFT_181176 [Ophiobolus disseminans]
MSRVGSQLARQQFKFFTAIHAPEYTTLIANHVVSDHSHPLNATQKRRAREKKKDGLWWHATTSVSLTRSSCVRTWARRRLHEAVVGELKARGYDKDGKLINLKSPNSQETPSTQVNFGKLLDLRGSLRLHVLPPLIPAKFVEIKAEVGRTLDIVINAARGENLSTGVAKKTIGRPHWNPPPHAQTKKTSPSQRKMA